MYILTKIEATNPASTVAKVGEPFIGECDPKALKVGEGLLIANFTKWRLLSETQSIEDDGEDGYIIKTLNSVYTLKPHKK